MAAAAGIEEVISQALPAAKARFAERLLQRTEDPGALVRRRTVLPVRLIPRGSGELPPAGK